MNIANKTTKAYIKSLPPTLALQLIKDYKIPSPYAEILRATCVERLNTFEAVATISKDGIYLSFWQYGDKLQIALDMFCKAHIHAGNDYSHLLVLPK